MSDATPQVSVVMPCFQQVHYLRPAVESVLEQSGVSVELLVMDPGSTDGSRELLVELVQHYGARLVACLEPDRGQSDAVNRGLARARGRVFGWLNSDDRLRPGALEAAWRALGAQPGPAWAYGRVATVDARGNECWRWVARYKSWRGRRFSRHKLLVENFVPQMGAFFNRAMWERHGGLDLGKDLDMDYDLWLRFAAVAPPAVLHATLAEFRVHRASKSLRESDAQLAAAYRTARDHAAGLGWRGTVALQLHRACAWRTRLVYRLLKRG